METFSRFQQPPHTPVNIIDANVFSSKITGEHLFFPCYNYILTYTLMGLSNNITHCNVFFSLLNLTIDSYRQTTNSASDEISAYRHLCFNMPIVLSTDARVAFCHRLKLFSRLVTEFLSGVYKFDLSGYLY